LQKQHTDFYEPLAKRKSIKEAPTVPSPASTVINYETFEKREQAGKEDG